MNLALTVVSSFFLLFLVTPQAFALMNDEQPIEFAWNKETINVVLVNDVYTNNDRIAEVTEVVTSTEFYTVEDNLLHKDIPGIYSPYYRGWQGALDNTNSTDIKLNFEVTNQGGGDIIISLTPQSSPDGYSGSAKPLFVNGEISKVYITVYDIDKISLNGLYSVLMHEMGHALGLGHSTAPEEVMYEKITTPYPYVTPCMMLALDQAYQENKPGLVTCLK